MDDRARRAKVMFWLADSEPFSLQFNAETLRRDGWRTKTFKGVTELFEGMDIGPELRPDGLFLDADMRMGASRAIAYAIRCGEFGYAALMPIVMVTAEMDEATKARLTGLGADLILPKPFSAATLQKVAMAIPRMKRVFIASSHYIGPDIRDQDPRLKTCKPIEVPQVLAMRLAGRKVAEDVLLNEAWLKLQTERLRADVIGSFVCVRQIVEGKDEGEMREAVRRMARIAKDGCALTQNTEFAAASEAFSAAGLWAKTVNDRAQLVGEIGADDKTMAEKVCEALRRTILPDLSLVDLAAAVKAEVEAWSEYKAQIRSYRDVEVALD